jgi:hypothetical protein
VRRKPVDKKGEERHAAKDDDAQGHPFINAWIRLEDVVAPIADIHIIAWPRKPVSPEAADEQHGQTVAALLNIGVMEMALISATRAG